jgi:hypothetical protein
MAGKNVTQKKGKEEELAFKDSFLSQSALCFLCIIFIYTTQYIYKELRNPEKSNHLFCLLAKVTDY